MKEAASSEGYALDDKLRSFQEYLAKQGVGRDKIVQHYLAARSFYVWNCFIEKLRSPPGDFRKLIAVNAYDWDNPSLTP